MQNQKEGCLIKKILIPVLAIAFILSVVWFSFFNVSVRPAPINHYTDIQRAEKTVNYTPSEPAIPYTPPEIPETQPSNYVIEQRPGIFGFINRDTNIFAIEILGGYYLTTNHNASIAARAINNYIIGPQETFSFNHTVGPRTPEKGYIAGTIVIGNSYATGIGGGICRTSTALYNAALAAGLTVTESYRHTMPVNYASRGRDAAVASSLDLKIVNNKEFPVQILTCESDGILYIALQKYPELTETEEFIQTPEEKTAEPTEKPTEENLLEELISE